MHSLRRIWMTDGIVFLSAQRPNDIQSQAMGKWLLSGPSFTHRLKHRLSESCCLFEQSKFSFWPRESPGTLKRTRTVHSIYSVDDRGCDESTALATSPLIRKALLGAGRIAKQKSHGAMADRRKLRQAQRERRKLGGAGLEGKAPSHLFAQ